MFRAVLILLIITSLTSSMLGQPATHRFKAYFEDNGYADGFSIYHAGIGGIKTLVNEGFWWLNEINGWTERPSPSRQVFNNFLLSVSWEVLEFYMESPKRTWKSYNKFYGGYALQNNGMDIFLDCAVFAIPHYKGMYYDFRIWKHGFNLNMTMEI